MAAPSDPGALGTLPLPAPFVRDIRDAILLKEGDLFLLTDLEGNVPCNNLDGFGLYHEDTRFLCGYEVAIEGLRPTVLLSSERTHSMGAQVLTNPRLVVLDGRNVDSHTLQIRRYRILRSTEASESLSVQNFNTFPLRLHLAIHFDADFADIFEVRGIAGGAPRGRRRAPVHAERVLTFGYEGRDGLARQSSISFDPVPELLAEGVASYALDLPAHGSQRIALSIRVRTSPIAASRPERTVARAPNPAQPARPSNRVRVTTSNPLFDAVFQQSRRDLRVLVSGEGDDTFVAAGIPWYATLFGRDALITALADLWLSPDSARRTLRLLARHQASRDDPWRDGEPGKILHELRRGELANAGAIPFTPYYGTADATPLWVMLLGQTFVATGDKGLVRELLPCLERALAWMDGPGDPDGDGFIEYAARSPHGLVNQGWKDSTDGIMHADGSFPEAPIALVEVQAYAYAARRAAAHLFRALGDAAGADALLAQAAALRRAFDDAFWLPSESTYCLALDGSKRRLATVASNAGHALWCGIVPPERAEAMAHRLMSEDLFSGFGIRTLSTKEIAYNPTGYHVGTVWPHDNAIIAQGFKRYGQEALALEVVSGMFEAARKFPLHRMPELFCGFARSAFGMPVRYPLACSPQAWAAAAWSAFLQVMLGVHPDASAGEVVIVRPRLPAWLEWVHVESLPAGAGFVDLRYQRAGEHTAVDVARIRGDARVTFVQAWEPG